MPKMSDVYVYIYIPLISDKAFSTNLSGNQICKDITRRHIIQLDRTDCSERKVEQLFRPQTMFTHIKNLTNKDFLDSEKKRLMEAANISHDPKRKFQRDDYQGAYESIKDLDSDFFRRLLERLYENGEEQKAINVKKIGRKFVWWKT